jgi:hypothetical protein
MCPFSFSIWQPFSLSIAQLEPFQSNQQIKHKDTKMKWYSFISVSFLLGTVIAADPAQVPEPTKYRLMVTT